ncbi:hypothetical protein C1637_09935 [Chryseobacterium lactis]|uniref:Uncharacterized protein n=1 Tax=Chryseobacterium lactis TaxID=1241981 RepID=A0A3G6RBW7_CHRLC|nr:hypothetical protein [Chryseobacterium lactis]AZA82170.1 hypothetical protein EG342_09765 [Chryseobacterium lactis]AZB02551.1 hypothetical protein EG341_00620 [Chryseobacterium lactis]PNW14154.1 hypothetical protein C1637_09935 [Chryseobacterium lactis]
MNNIYYIPEGVTNLKPLFPQIDWSKIVEYSIVVKGNNSSTIAESRINKVDCCCLDDKVRIHFINSFGEIDSVNFIRVLEETETKSESWEKSLKFPLDRSKGGSYRKNITSNETYEVETRCYGESDQYWFKDLMNTPKSWIELNLPNGFKESIKKEFIPIEIADLKLITRKNERRYEYIVKIKFTMSNDNVTLR